MRMTLAEKIKTTRKRKGLSQEELALLTDLTQGRISLYERGKKKPTAKTIRALETVLGPLREQSEREEEIVTLTPAEAEAARAVTERAMRIELGRLDELHAALWSRATAGEEDAPAAVDRLLAIMDRRIQIVAYLEAVPASPAYDERLATEQDLLAWHRDVISGRATVTKLTSRGGRVQVPYGETARAASALRIEHILNTAAERQRDYIPRSDVQRVLAELALLVRDRLRSMAARGMIRHEDAQQILDEMASESHRRWSALVE